MLFSATYPDQVREFAQKFAPYANEIKLKHEELTVDGIKQFYMECESVEHKIQMLISIYSLMTIGQSIIFCRVGSHLPTSPPSFPRPLCRLTLRVNHS